MKPESVAPEDHRLSCCRNLLEETCSKSLVDCVADSDFPSCRVVVFMSQYRKNIIAASMF